MTTNPIAGPEPAAPLVPPELRAIVDAAAGREHSAEGSVMRCLADVLDAHKKMLTQGAASARVAEYTALDATPTIRTGLADLDALLGGLRGGTVTVLASRPGVGRSTLLSDTCRATAVGRGVPTLVYSLESSAPEFMQRIVAAEARVPLHHVRCGTLSAEEQARVDGRAEKITAAPLYVKAPPRIGLVPLALEVEALVAARGIRLLAVDGLEDIRDADNVLRELKVLARELGIAVVVTTGRLSRLAAHAGRLPVLDDLRDHEAFGADVVVLVHRDDAFDAESERAGEADLVVAKHRSGPEGQVVVAFQGRFGRFVDFADV